MTNKAKLVMHGGQGLEGEYDVDSPAEALALIARYYGHEEFATTLEEIIADPDKQKDTCLIMDNQRITLLREVAAIPETRNGKDTQE